MPKNDMHLSIGRQKPFHPAFVVVFFFELVVVFLLDLPERGFVAAERRQEGVGFGVDEHILLLFFFTVLFRHIFLILLHPPLTIHIRLDLHLLLHIRLVFRQAHVGQGSWPHSPTNSRELRRLRSNLYKKPMFLLKNTFFSLLVGLGSGLMTGFWCLSATTVDPG